MRLAPSQEELDQYVEAVSAGVPSDVARKEIWTDRQPAVILSLVENNVVGWDTCGTCGRSIVKCTCSAGPAVPPYVTAWRREAREKEAASVGAGGDQG